MSSRRTSAANLLAVALLIISLLLLPLLHLPVAHARHVAVLKATDSSSAISIRSGHVEPTPASGAVQRRPASSGANNPGGGRRRPAASSRSTVEMRASAWAKHHRDEVARMHEMLKRDYASKARRRSPINNGEPSLEEDLP
uniref:DUF4408 domain-containing protein n=1 Tax=Oryza meridionalis TaxID=40149 RepID=A0A0E0DF39_9ORYZ